LFARPEGCPQYYSVKFDVAGAGAFSMCAELAGGGRHTAVIYAVLPQNARITERPSGDTARPSKAKKPIGRPKTAGGMDGIKKVKKTWMMPLQQCRLRSVSGN